jgi:hypothetical protein
MEAYGIQTEAELAKAQIQQIAVDNQRAQIAGQQSAKLASQFFDRWNTALGETKGIYNKAIAASNQSMGLINNAIGKVGDFDKIVAELKQTGLDYDQKYGGFEQEAIGAAKEGLQAERALTGRIMDYSQEDQGASGRAMADVGVEAEKGRQAEAMRLQGLGVDPTSGRFAGGLRRDRIQTALNKSLAGNAAKLAEKSRAGAYAIQGMNAIDPSVAGNMAQNVSQGRQDIMKTRTGAAQTALGARTNLATASGQVGQNLANIGTARSNAITQPMGEMYGTMLGSTLANAPGALGKV